VSASEAASAVHTAGVYTSGTPGLGPRCQKGDGLSESDSESEPRRKSESPFTTVASLSAHWHLGRCVSRHLLPLQATSESGVTVGLIFIEFFKFKVEQLGQLAT
jgi:hypothetical protein